METFKDYRLSPNQERFVYAELATGFSYHLPYSYELQGELNPERLKQAISSVCQRHDSLRTSFVNSEGHEYIARIHSQPDFEFETRKAKSWDDEYFKALIHDFFFTGSELERKNLVRFLLVQCEDRYLFTFSLHHAIADGVSIQVFISELSEAYNALYGDKPVTVFQENFAGDWRKTPHYRKARTYYQSLLANKSEPAGFLADLDSSDKQSVHASVTDFIDATLFQSSASMAGDIGVSVFTLYYAVYSVLIHKYSGQSNILTTFQSANRRNYPGHDKTIGPFSNAVVLSIEVDSTQAFKAFCCAIKSDIKSALEHQAIPYQDVIEIMGQHPRYGINWYPKVANLSLDKVRSQRYSQEERQSDFDINIRFTEDGEGLGITVYFDSSSFSETRIHHFIKQFQGLLKQLCGSPDISIDQLNLFLAGDINTLPDPSQYLADHNEDPIYKNFFDQAQLNGNNIAIEYKSSKWTYAEVEKIVNQVAGKLFEHDFKAGSTVAILSDRNPDLVWTILAASSAGATFVVLDEAYPAQRLQQYWDIVRPNILIVAGDKALSHDWIISKNSVFDNYLQVSNGVVDDRKYNGVYSSEIANQNDDRPAYYLFTSGTTGTPHCIATSHSPLVHFVKWEQSNFNLTANDRFTCLSGLGHDPVLRDIFTPLSLGATICMPDQNTIFDPHLLSKWIASSRPTVLHLTPQLLQIFFAGLKATDSLDSIKYLLVGGDVLSISLRKRIRQALPSVSLVNVYGATETPQVAGYYVDDPIQDWKSLPVGQGISDTQLLIVDSNGSQLAVGQVGEIAVRSNYLAIGYLGDSANMAELEEWNKKISSTTDNTYLTGDRGYYLPDGNVICLGRTDDQVKIRGFRVELSEIDVELCRIEHIDQAITVYVEKQDSNPALVSYIVSKKDNENDSQRVKNSLESRLPSHMIPAYFVFLNQIPLLPNGKVDRQALPAPGINDRSLHAEYIPPTTDSEISLVNDWEKILGVSPISVESTYSDLGGDSLSYVSTYVALEDKIGKVPDDWTVKTVKELAGLRNKSNWLSWIDTSMLVRAFSIFFIVAGHSKLFSLGGGFTSSLFMVSGFLLASLQIRQINYFQSSRPLYDLLLKVLLPTLIYSVIAHLTFKETHLSTLLLYSNFVPFDTPGRVVWLWYVHCMIQIIAIMWLLVSIDRIRKVLLKNTYTMLLVMYVVSVFLSLLSVYMTEPLYLTQGVPKQDILNWLPQTHLPTFLLGMLAYASSDRSKKLYSLMVALPYLLMAYYAFPRDFNMILIALIMLMFIKEVPMVKPLNYIVLTLSGASLFIYLTHFQWVSIVEKLGFYEKPILFTVVGLLGGVLVWRLWLKFQTVARHVIKIHLKR